MTNKEAVTILNSIKMFFCREDGTPFSVGYDAITKAVKLLDRLPDDWFCADGERKDDEQQT